MFKLIDLLFITGLVLIVLSCFAEVGINNSFNITSAYLGATLIMISVVISIIDLTNQ